MKYPIYIPSKGRAHCCIAAECLLKEGLEFKVVVEPHEVDAYAERCGRERLLILPSCNAGIAASRNFAKSTARELGFEFHWTLDDDVRQAYRLNNGKNVECTFAEALEVVENFCDCYENIAFAGFKGYAFAYKARTAYAVNQNVYSFCSLIKTTTPFVWRGPLKPGPFHEDVDYWMQVLTAGQCAVLFNVYNVDNGNPADAAETIRGHADIVRTLQARWGRPSTEQPLFGEDVAPISEIKTVERNGRFFPGMSAVCKQFKQRLKLKPGASAFALPEFTPRALPVVPTNEMGFDSMFIK